MIIRILGCGTSSGVPMLGCNCAVCSSALSKNRRMRVSALFSSSGSRLLIDTPPDIREQLLTARVNSLSGVAYTHAHADHVHGIDDLRAINYLIGKPLPTYGTDETLNIIKSRFGYAFSDYKLGNNWRRPCLEPKVLPKFWSEFAIGDLKVKSFPQQHGGSESVGYIVNNNVAYSTDFNLLNKDTIKRLKNIKVWIIDCLGYDKHPTHANLETTLNYINQVKPSIAILTHMSHQFDYNTIMNQTPDSVFPAFDGMEIEVTNKSNPIIINR